MTPDKKQACDLLIEGALTLEGKLVDPGAVLVEGGQVIWSGPRDEMPDVDVGQRIDTKGFIVPGFVDLHVHGGAGADAIDGDPDSLSTICCVHAAHGTTALCPTVLTGPSEAMLRALEMIRQHADAGQPVGGGARVIGANLEGPFLNPRRAGAQPGEHLRDPDPALMEELLDAGGAALKIVTLAPELPGALDLVARLRERGVVVAMGHSEATYSQAIDGINAGIGLAAHTFNAMRPLHHREPGLVGATLESDQLVAEVIADGVHLSEVVLRLLWRLKGPERLCLVTDCTAALEAPPGGARLGSQPVTIHDGAVRLPDGTLAGSSLSMDRAVGNLIRLCRASVSQASVAASSVPARVLGLERLGSLTANSEADLVLLDRQHRVTAVLVAGQLVAGEL